MIREISLGLLLTLISGAAGCGRGPEKENFRLQLKLPKPLARGTSHYERLRRRVTHVDLKFDSKEGEVKQAGYPPEAWESPRSVTEIQFPKSDHDELKITAQVWGRNEATTAYRVILKGEKTVAAREVSGTDPSVQVDLHLVADGLKD